MTEPNKPEVNVDKLMRKIKAVFDPNGILNPGKIWED